MKSIIIIVMCLITFNAYAQYYYGRPYPYNQPMPHDPIQMEMIRQEARRNSQQLIEENRRNNQQLIEEMRRQGLRNQIGDCELALGCIKK